MHQGTVLCQVFYNLAKVVKPDREPSPGASPGAGSKKIKIFQKK